MPQITHTVLQITQRGGITSGSHARDDLHDGERAIADGDGLLGAGGAQEGQRRGEHLC